MARLRRFEDYRYIGTRDTMVFYDCDDDEQFEELEERMRGAVFDQKLAVELDVFLTGLRDRFYIEIKA